MTPTDIDTWDDWRENVLFRLTALEAGLTLSADKHDNLIENNAGAHARIERSITDLRVELTESITELRADMSAGFHTLSLDLNSFKVKSRILWGAIGSFIPLLTGIGLYFITQWL